MRGTRLQPVVHTFGASPRRRGERFVVRACANQNAFAAGKVRSILVATAVHLSSDAMVLAIPHNIDVVILDRSLVQASDES